jgi:maltose O-acetyltransferase
MPTIIAPGGIAGRLTIGERCGFNIGCLLDLEAPVTIGNHVSFGHDVLVLTGSTERGPGAPVVIEDGAWIAARAVIMPGVTVGAGAVIGATVVVSQDVPPNTLIAGPQRISLARWR